MNRKDRALELVRGNPGLLACPVCGRELLAGEHYILICPQRHSFDLASSGYVNLLTAPVTPDYGSGMLEARGRVCRSGFFDGLIRVLRDVAAEYLSAERIVALDAGCGEGSHLARLSAMLGGNRLTGVGADISKEGIRIAAREYPGFLWCVADLARLPLSAGSVDLVLNVLSPANYAQFSRVLKAGGVLLKAVPGAEYLGELRLALYPERQNEYSGERVKKLFQDFFPSAETRHVRYAVNTQGETLRDLVEMTPLSWRAPEESRRAVIDRGSMEVTAEFDILIARKA